MKKIILFLFVFIALSANSQIIENLIEPSWELNPTGDPPCDDVEKVVASLLEMNNGDFVVSIVPLYPGGEAKLVKFDQNGNMLQETILHYDENYEVATILLDEWNGSMNAFMILCNMTENNAVIMHSYIFEDATTSEPKEIWRKEFTETRDLRVYSDRVLIDKNGCRTFMFEFSEYPDVPPVDYYPIILKIDANLNVISEKEYESEELNNSNMPYCCFTYSADSTQYYYVSYNSTEHPYGYFMNVFDMDLNLTEQIPFVSDPPIDLQSFGGNWSQNPYDGKIYGLGNKYDIYTLKDRCVFKVDIENKVVEVLKNLLILEKLLNAQIVKMIYIIIFGILIMYCHLVLNVRDIIIMRGFIIIVIFFINVHNTKHYCILLVGSGSQKTEGFSSSLQSWFIVKQRGAKNNS